VSFWPALRRVGLAGALALLGLTLLALAARACDPPSTQGPPPARTSQFFQLSPNPMSQERSP
jgi:hypothetical protein